MSRLIRQLLPQTQRPAAFYPNSVEQASQDASDQASFWEGVRQDTNDAVMADEIPNMAISPPSASEFNDDVFARTASRPVWTIDPESDRPGMTQQQEPEIILPGVNSPETMVLEPGPMVPGVMRPVRRPYVSRPIPDDGPAIRLPGVGPTREAKAATEVQARLGPAVQPPPPPPPVKPLDAMGSLANRDRKPVKSVPVAMNAGPESLVPAPGEERLGPNAAGEAQARAKPVPLPASREMRDRYLDSVWPGMRRVAEAHGVTLMGLRRVYDEVMARNGASHADGVGAVKTALGQVKTQQKATSREFWQDQNNMDHHARRAGYTPEAYRLEQSLDTATPQQRISTMIALHQQNPGAGWGNLAAMELANMSKEEQARVLNQGNVPKLSGPQQLEQWKNTIRSAPPSASTMDDWISFYQQSPAGQADPKGGRRFALDMMTPQYVSVHGQDLSKDPEKEQFVRRYMQSFSSYAEWRKQTGVPDSPESRAWWTKYTGSSPDGMMANIWNGFTAAGAAAGQAASYVGGGIQAMRNARPPVATNQQPPDGA